MNNETEVWKDVVGYEGLYQVSNLGNVKSLFWRKKNKTHRKEHFLKKVKHHAKNGYCREVVRLTKDGKGRNAKVHRLVAEAFLPNPNNLPQVNHIDGNTFNNNVNNLEWCTARENVIHAIETGLKDCYRPTKEELEEMYINQRVPLREIVKQKKTNVEVVKKYLNKYGIKIRSKCEADTKYFITKEFLEKELKHKTQAQIAREIGCDPSLISKYKNKFNL